MKEKLRKFSNFKKVELKEEIRVRGGGSTPSYRPPEYVDKIDTFYDNDDDQKVSSGDCFVYESNYNCDDGTESMWMF